MFRLFFLTGLPPLMGLRRRDMRHKLFLAWKATQIGPVFTQHYLNSFHANRVIVVRSTPLIRYRASRIGSSPLSQSLSLFAHSSLEALEALVVTAAPLSPSPTVCEESPDHSHRSLLDGVVHLQCLPQALPASWPVGFFDFTPGATNTWACDYIGWYPRGDQL